jgi:hypothetical protein
MRHYAKFRNEEVIILGYKASMNSVMISRVTMLPGDDQSILRQIASSVYAQDNCDYLVTVLQSERHKSGTDWFTYLATRLQRNDGSVSVIPLKELVDMNPEQRAFFKGWGKTITEAGEKAEAEEHLGMGSAVMGEDYKPTLDPNATVGPSGVKFPVTQDNQNKQMMDMISQMAASQAALADSVAKLAEQVNSKPAPVKRKTTARKKTATKKAASAA